MHSVPTRRELLAWFVAFALMMTFAVGWVTNRAEGADEGRTEASTESVAQPIPDLAPIAVPTRVYIATGADFPDALGAGAAAAMAMGPVLFVSRNSIPGPTYTELNRLEPSEIIIIGGTSVVSDTVETALEDLPFAPTVTRIAGTNRYDTAAQLSAESFYTRGFFPRVVGVEGTDLLIQDGTDKVILTINYTTDRPGVFTIFADTDTYVVSGGEDLFNCSIEVDDVVIASSRRWVHPDATAGNAEENCSTQGYSQDLVGGSHKFEFVISGADSYARAQYRNMIVHWTPYYPGS